MKKFILSLALVASFSVNAKAIDAAEFFADLRGGSEAAFIFGRGMIEGSRVVGVHCMPKSADAEVQFLAALAAYAEDHDLSGKSPGRVLVETLRRVVPCKSA